MISEVQYKDLLFVLFLVGLGVLIILITLYISNGFPKSEVYLDCAEDFANKYCESLNYSRTIIYRNGIRSFNAFGCKSERSNQVYGEFILTTEEEKYCKELVEDGKERKTP